MKILNFQKIAFVGLMMFFIPIYLYSNNGINKNSPLNFQKPDSLAQIKNSKTENALGEKFYLKWRKSKTQSNLDSAQVHFFKACNYLPLILKHPYALEKARLYHNNIENSLLMKDWYFNSIYYLKISVTPTIDEVLKRYEIIKEFIKAYSRAYNKCGEALEILQDYKSDLYFEHIQNNPSEKRYTSLMHELEVEERYLSFDCVQQK